MAAADALRVIANAPYRHTFAIRNTAGNVVSGATSLDSEYSADSSGFGDAAAEATEIGSTGVYTLDLTAAEFTFASSYSVVVSSTEGVEHFQELHAEPALDSGVVQSATSTTVTIRSAASAVDDYYNGAEIEIVRGTGIGQVRTIIDYTGSSVAVTVDRAWATNPAVNSVYIIRPAVGVKHGTDILAVVNVDQIDGDATAALNMMSAWKGAVVHDSLTTPFSSTTFTGVTTSATDDVYNGMMVWITAATNSDNVGQVRKVSDYTGSTKLFTVANAFPDDLVSGDTFMLLGEVF